MAKQEIGMDWIVEPYVGVGPLKFGMTSEEVLAILGPTRKRTQRENSISEYRKGMENPIIHYRNEKISEVTFTRFTKSVIVDGLNYYEINPKDFTKHIAFVDENLIELPANNLISKKFGISFDEYEFEDSDKSITVFERGIFDRPIMGAVLYRAA
jgi:hypothetical protein